MTGFDNILGQLRAAGEQTRLRILLLLRESELTVTELTEILDQSQPRVSRHLKVLADSGLVERFHEGAWVFYRLAAPLTLGPLADLLAESDTEALPEDMTAFARIRERRAKQAADYFAAQASHWEALRALHIADEKVEEALLELSGGPGETFLDLGTGTGRMLMLFADHYEQGIGYDLSPEMLAIARSRVMEAGLAHAQVRRGDFMEDPLQDGADIICLHHVLHYLTAPEQAIKAAAEAVTPTGRILIADFAPHTHEDLRETHAHRRLGFEDTEIEGWARRNGLHLIGDRRLEPPREGGLVTRVWCLSPQKTSQPFASSHSTHQVPHAAS
ncbi:ArsR/SmtB family transcription factor [Parvularcula marina]|uniref:ArsR/SmtB family transcription factor n=1 Tax=Parvularcula marina TaxID=2292771 RepID=UPI003518755B